MPYLYIYIYIHNTGQTSLSLMGYFLTNGCWVKSQEDPQGHPMKMGAFVVTVTATNTMKLRID